MNKTIEYTIATVFGVIIMGVLLSKVPSNLQKETEPPSIDSLKVRRDGSDIVVSWETDSETNGLIRYANDSGTFQERYSEYSTTHMLRIVEQSGDVAMNLTSCEINGRCSKTRQINKTI